MEKRIFSYDIFRGILTIWMIIFHLFLNLTNFEINTFFYYWIPVGFMIFFWAVIGQFLSKKPKKILFLSLKLLLIFLLLNSKNIFDNFNSNIFQNLLIWNQEIFSFEILFAMWFSLFLIPFFSFLNKIFWKFFAIFPLFFILILDFTSFYSYNLLFIFYWLFWFLAWKNFNLDNFSKKILEKKNSKYLLILWFFISTFSVIFFELRFLVILQVLFLYFLANFIFWENKILIFLWKNSLFIYIFHIFLIKWIAFFLK